MATEESYNLLEDCWERVFKFLHDDHHRYLEPLSLVSKQFLSITNRLRSSLKLCNQTLPHVLHRFPNLTSIDLNYLFALLKNCRFISEIRMERTSIGIKGEEEEMDYVVNTQLKSLYLALNVFLKDESITIFASMCPNLQLLYIGVLGIKTAKGEGAVEVLRRCCKIRHLSFYSLEQLPLNFQVPNLEVLVLFDSKIRDETLSVISKSCCGLLQLDLASCVYVTEKGVREVVEKCTQLREINLGDCRSVDANVVDWMIFSRPSLRKITAPPSFHCSDSQRDLFLRQGCRVLDWYYS